MVHLLDVLVGLLSSFSSTVLRLFVGRNGKGEDIERFGEDSNSKEAHEALLQDYQQVNELADAQTSHMSDLRQSRKKSKKKKRKKKKKRYFEITDHADLPILNSDEKVKNDKMLDTEQLKYKRQRSMPTFNSVRSKQPEATLHQTPRNTIDVNSLLQNFGQISLLDNPRNDNWNLTPPFNSFQGKRHTVQRANSTLYGTNSRQCLSRQYQNNYSVFNIWKGYREIFLGDIAQTEIKEYYTNCVVVDSASRNETWNYCDEIVRDLLQTVGSYGITSTEPDTEGSLVTGVKTGKADECDFSVEICLCDKHDISLSDDPFLFVFEDDIDCDDAQDSGHFALNGKRFFQTGEERNTFPETTPESIRNGYTAVRIGDTDAEHFDNLCVYMYDENDKNWFIPFFLLSTFYKTMEACIHHFQFARNDNASINLNRAVKGPAVTLTVQETGSHNITVDITPKITLPSKVLSLYHFRWPRRKTENWLDESVIENILQQQIYLVPKGDKYWKISFANCENALLADIDATGTWRKGCLRLMKKKLSLWKSKSRTGLKGISSYHLKTTLLWLCEMLPDDYLWNEDQLANRYMTFLMELHKRLTIGHMGEYFNPKVNLIQGKDPEEIEEVQDFIVDEISTLHKTSSSVSQFEEYF